MSICDFCIGVCETPSSPPEFVLPSDWYHYYINLRQSRKMYYFYDVLYNYYMYVLYIIFNLTLAWSRFWSPKAPKNLEKSPSFPKKQKGLHRQGRRYKKPSVQLAMSSPTVSVLPGVLWQVHLHHQVLVWKQQPLNTYTHVTALLALYSLNMLLSTLLASSLLDLYLFGINCNSK